MPAIAYVVVLAAALSAVTILAFLLSRTHATSRAKTARLFSANESLQRLNRSLERRASDAETRADHLDARERWYRNLFDSSRDMVLVYRVTDQQLPGRFTDVNQVACEKLEYQRDKLLTMTALDVEAIREAEAVAPRDPPGIDLLKLSNAEILGRANTAAGRYMQMLVRQVVKEHQVIYDGGYVTRTGRMIPVEITAHRYDVDAVTMIVCTAHDITERRKTEMALRESERRFQDFCANFPIGVATYDAQKELVNVNAACLKMFGMPDRLAFAQINPFDAPLLPEAARESLNRGGTVHAEVTVDFRDILKHALFPTSRNDVAHFDVLINTLRLDHDFNPKGRILQIQDITRRRNAEAALRQSERQLRQAQKMAALGTLAGGVAHDFNNILTPIQGYAELGVTITEEGDELHEFMQEILKASDRASGLVEQILTFSRQAEQAVKPMLVTPIIKEVVKQLGASLPDEIQVKPSLKTERDLVLATPAQIHQIVMNLCANAEYAMRGGGGVLQVRMTNFVLHHRHGSEFPNLRPGHYLRLSISDTGIGMAPELLARAFDPFYTTKPSGEGTGMGLAVVHGLVTSLGGTVRAETEAGKGSTFHVILPTVEPQVEMAPTRDEVPLAMGEERILFVDDERVILKMAARMLSSLGYETVVTEQSTEALDMFRENPDRFDLVITDHVMPELTGGELARELLKIRPEMPIILCTGFSEKLSALDAEKIGISAFMMKPITIRQLATTIRSVLAPQESASAVVTDDTAAAEGPEKA